MKKLPNSRKNPFTVATNRQIADGANSLPSPASLLKGDAGTEQEAKDVVDVKAQALAALLQAGGVKDADLAARIIEQVNRIQAPWPFGYPNEGFQFAVEMLLEMKPETFTEALLAVQMVGVHHAALAFLHRAAFSGQSPERSDFNVALASRLMRLFAEQTGAMARLKGRVGQQSVTVKHVHVYQGGQAVVGAVSSAELNQGEGGNEKTRKKTP
jgi:hypothetical protein